MNIIWRIEVDRFRDETIAKSGRTYSLEETCNDIVNRYNANKVKPIIEVVAFSLGRMLIDMLADKGIPFRVVNGTITRVNGADIFKYTETQRKNNGN